MENTGKKYHNIASFEDHLHIRGEYAKFNQLALDISGSPPHTWRILNYFPSMDGVARITSTYVENTEVSILNKVRIRDHLHIRGEYGVRIC